MAFLTPPLQVPLEAGSSYEGTVFLFAHDACKDGYERVRFTSSLLPSLFPSGSPHPASCSLLTFFSGDPVQDMEGSSGGSEEEEKVEVKRM